jgi:hypothetical protein
MALRGDPTTAQLLMAVEPESSSRKFPNVTVTPFSKLPFWIKSAIADTVINAHTTALKINRFINFSVRFLVFQL